MSIMKLMPFGIDSFSSFFSRPVATSGRMLYWRCDVCVHLDGVNAVLNPWKDDYCNGFSCGHKGWTNNCQVAETAGPNMPIEWKDSPDEFQRKKRKPENSSVNTDAPTDVGGCVQSSSAREDRSTDAGSTRQRRYPESPTFTAPTQLTSDTPITNALYLSICLKEKCNVKEDWVVENVEVSKIKSDAEVYEKIRAVFEKHLPHPFGKMPLRRYFYRRIEEIRISNIILGKRGVRACVPLRRVKCDPKLYDIDSSGPAISTDALTKRVLRPPAHGLEPYEWHFMPKRRATPLEWRHPQDGQLGNVNAGLGIEIVLRSKNKRRIKAIHRLAKIIGAVLLVLTISLAFTVLKESKVVTLTVGMLVSSILPVFMAALAPLA